MDEREGKGIPIAKFWEVVVQYYQRQLFVSCNLLILTKKFCVQTKLGWQVEERDLKG